MEAPLALHYTLLYPYLTCNLIPYCGTMYMAASYIHSAGPRPNHFPKAPQSIGTKGLCGRCGGGAFEEKKKPQQSTFLPPRICARNPRSRMQPSRHDKLISAPNSLQLARHLCGEREKGPQPRMPVTWVSPPPPTLDTGPSSAGTGSRAKMGK